MKRRGPALFELISGGTVGRRPAPPSLRTSPAEPSVKVDVDPPESRVESRAEANGQEAVEVDRRDETEAAPARGSESFARGATPAARVEHEPAQDDDPEPEPEASVHDRSDDEADADAVAASSTSARADEPGRFTVTPSVLLLAGAGVIMVCVLVWSVAYDVGRNEAEEAARRELRLQAEGTVRDPLNTDLPLNRSLVKPETRPPQAPSAPAGSTGAAASRPSGVAVPSPIGDPREVGKNYLQLVTTDKADADAIVKFLAENGVGAFHVPLDGPGTGANNRARFVVFCTRGITPEEFKAQSPARTELYDAVGRLGKVWKKERRGSTDFAGRMWSKYTR